MSKSKGNIPSHAADIPPPFQVMVGVSDGLRKAVLRGVKASKSDSNVLILGEHGTGKELLARAIHVASSRKDAPFIKVNCAAIQDSLIESEFFGYEEGAFTGARKEGKKGFFELANGGTLFLDEVGDLSLAAQAKLLSAIQEREFIKVGGEKTINVDVRLISATNKDIRQMVDKGEFRADLYYRLNVIEIHLPPLRERREDIEILVNYYLHRYCKNNGINKVITRETMSYLVNHRWEGNVRELFNVVEYAIVISDEVEIHPDNLPPYILEGEEEKKEEKEALEDAWRAILGTMDGKSWKDFMREVEKNLLSIYIQQPISRSEMIKRMGISRTQFYEKIRKFGLEEKK